MIIHNNQISKINTNQKTDLLLLLRLFWVKVSVLE